MTDYTQAGKLKIGRTYEPKQRPTFEQWAKDLKISHTVYNINFEARKKSAEINSNMGITIDNRSIWQIIKGDDYIKSF